MVGETRQPYAYADNNPLLMVDPDGLRYCPASGGPCYEDPVYIGKRYYTAEDGAARLQAICNLATVDANLDAHLSTLGFFEGFGRWYLTTGADLTYASAPLLIGLTASIGTKPNGARITGTSQIKPGSTQGSASGKAFGQSTKQQVLEENLNNNNGVVTCVYCKQPTTTPHVDHAIPKSKGGNATLENGQAACPHCNISKGNRDFPATPPPGYVGEWPPTHWSQ